MSKPKGLNSLLIFIIKKSLSIFIITLLQSALGTNGVLLFPTFPVSAFNHYGLFCNMAGVSYTMIFNLMGFPSTHVPTGMGSDKLPIGFQVSILNFFNIQITGI